MENWYGVVEKVTFKDNGPRNDPGLVYKGLEFNYWDIEDAVLEMYRDDLMEQYPDDEFLNQINFEVVADQHDSHFLSWLEDNQERITGYFDDVIYGGYFPE